MKLYLSKISLLLFIFFSNINMYSQEYKIEKDVKRILFLGNSITYQAHYVNFIKFYFDTQYPEKKNEIINVGLPSETASGLSESNHAKGKFPRPKLHDRLNRILKLVKPDLIIACYGINDGIYLPFNERRFRKYKRGIEKLDKQVKKTSSDIIYLTPTLYDKKGGEAYANVMDIYSNWLVSKRFTDNWKVIDIHKALQKSLDNYQVKNPDFVFSKDGIHPSKLGHFIIAKSVLIAFGEDKLNTISSFKELTNLHPEGNEILKLISNQQQVTKDAWLTFIGHKRPNMKKGLPIKEALEKSKALQKEIDSLFNIK